MNPWLRTPETRLLLAHITGKSKTWWLTHLEASPSAAEQALLQAAEERLRAGEPLPYLLGKWEFYGLEFEINPDVLIPRPETELLVEEACRWLKQAPATLKMLPCLDVATGSGILPVTLATLFPEMQFAATDISAAALEIARRNAQRQGVEGRITFWQGDLLAALPPQPRSFAVISANLPYIPSETLKELPIYGREPSLALDGGQDGLELIRRLVAELRQKNFQWGLLLLEIEYRQGQAVESILRENFPTAAIQIQNDLAGLPRLAKAEMPL